MFQPLQPRFVGIVAHSRREAARKGPTAEGDGLSCFLPVCR